MESSRPKEKRNMKEHITPGNGDRHEKNEQELDGTRKEGPGQRELNIIQVTNSFEVKTGVRQGCLLLHFLFLLVDWIMKTSTSEGKHEIQWTSRMQLDNLDFADDLALLSQTQEQMQEKMISVEAASAALGLNINKGKSKILRYKTTCNNPITIDGEDLEDVKTFPCTGSIIYQHSGSHAKVKARIGKTRALYLQLKDIWNSKQLSLNQQQTQDFQYKCQNSSNVSGVNLENYKSHHPEDTGVY
ncbi:unnamed protein product [Schistosoma curassoni]|uniref:Reverse transcriptase domain-containing protein n=1 Tax=Schistosoma curassoni TaxID=6186 RepID=A0A183KTC1_9TREM|nr:unnamed protein product [Schistosoma curassoni]